MVLHMAKQNTPMKTKLDLFDYFFCFAAADAISAGLVHGSIFPLTLGIIGYIVYEKIRKGQVDASRLH